MSSKQDKMVEVWYGSGKSFVLIHLSRQIEIDEPWEVTSPRQTSWAFLAEKKTVFSPAAANDTLHFLKLLLKLDK
jgi:hypothetical protein